ncbi:NADPH:quinone reductase [Catalinimonas alkaloidigena]|uniref:NADPH:quinone reductase n=1 Tax=Catalinimonas alkaloidigena TaxID=1075417 RepID=A0A1G9P555_9BACT|nr:NADP-dependent oxidoreductase [Catalinimonas alkaloidigena]SDL93357.1 NADPH:quinone reductase [Catalinimonas alkaloidigena]
MKAYVLTGLNRAEALRLQDLPVPELQAGEVLVKTMAIDINPVDSKTLQGKGQYPTLQNDAPIVLGWGLSGVVVQTSAEASAFQVGDEVFGLIRFPGHGRCYAEFVAVPVSDIARKPANCSHEQAAASTLATLMAYQALRVAAVRQGERVLIQGVAGGVGFPALQLAKHYGAYVIGTAAPKDIPFLLANGLDEAIDYTSADFEKETNNIDFVLDTLGGENVIKAFRILSANGRLITIPSGTGDTWKDLAARRHIKAQFLFVHSSGEDMQVLATWLAAGILTPRIAHRFTFREIPLIHEKMISHQLTGKTVVTVESA